MARPQNEAPQRRAPDRAQQGPAPARAAAQPCDRRQPWRAGALGGPPDRGGAPAATSHLACPPPPFRARFDRPSAAAARPTMHPQVQISGDLGKDPNFVNQGGLWRAIVAPPGATIKSRPGGKKKKKEPGAAEEAAAAGADAEPAAAAGVKPEPAPAPPQQQPPQKQQPPPQHQQQPAAEPQQSEAGSVAVARPAPRRQPPAPGNASCGAPWQGASAYYLADRLPSRQISVWWGGEQRFYEGKIAGAWVGSWTLLEEGPVLGPRDAACSPPNRPTLPPTARPQRRSRRASCCCCRSATTTARRSGRAPRTSACLAAAATPRCDDAACWGLLLPAAAAAGAANFDAL